MFIRQRGLSQKAFARKLSFPPSYISKIINEKCGLPKNFQMAFFSAFGFPIKELPEMLEKGTLSKIMETEASYEISTKEFLSENTKLNKALIHLIPILDIPTKKGLLKIIYEDYFDVLGYDWDDEKQIESKIAGKKERRAKQRQYSGKNKRKKPFEY